MYFAVVLYTPMIVCDFHDFHSSCNVELEGLGTSHKPQCLPEDNRIK